MKSWAGGPDIAFETWVSPGNAFKRASVTVEEAAKKECNLCEKREISPPDAGLFRKRLSDKRDKPLATVTRLRIFPPDPVPQGRLQIAQDEILGEAMRDEQSRPNGNTRRKQMRDAAVPTRLDPYPNVTQDFILGYSHPSLRDLLVGPLPWLNHEEHPGCHPG
jgi:hypothetical protein